MPKCTFEEVLRLLEQDGAAYDEARHRMVNNAVRFWGSICSTAAEHPDPVVRSKLIGVIAAARKIPVTQRRAVLEELLRNETHEIPLRSLRYILMYSLR